MTSFYSLIGTAAMEPTYYDAHCPSIGIRVSEDSYNGLKFPATGNQETGYSYATAPVPGGCERESA